MFIKVKMIFILKKEFKYKRKNVQGSYCKREIKLYININVLKGEYYYLV